LRAALEIIMDAAERGGGQIIVVDADPDLVRWHAQHGFLPTGGDNLQLFLKVATARKYLDSSEHLSNSS
jgi:spermidine synthase